MNVERIRDEAGFRALRDEWEALALRAPNRSVFLTWEWLFPWWRALGGDAALHLVTVRDRQGRLVGVAPLCIREEGRLGRTRVLGFLGTTRVSSEYLDLLVEPEQAEEVAKAVRSALLEGPQEWDIARLSDLLESSVLGRALTARRPGPAAVTFWDRCQDCPYLPLGTDPGAFWRGRGRSLRGAYARSLRKLQEIGLEYREVRGGAELAGALETLFDLHGRRWAREGRTGNLHDEPIRSFHRESAPLLAERDRIRIFELRGGGRTIASLYALEFRGRMTYYQSGFDPEPPDPRIRWGDYSPGLLIVGHCIEEAMARGLDEFDFLRGVEPYKLRWTSAMRSTRTLTLVPPGRPVRQGRVLFGRALARARRSAGRAVRAALEVVDGVPVPGRKP